MQDIIPPNRIPSRGHINPPTRSISASRPDAVYRSVYVARRVINYSSTLSSTVINSAETVITSSVTNTKPTELITNNTQPQTGLVAELSTEQKVQAMTRALETARRELDKERKKRSSLKRLSLMLTSAVILLVTGYVGIDTWMTNSKVRAESALTTQASSNVSNGIDDTSKTEGTDKQPLPTHIIAKYTVAPNLPRMLYINKINVSARILPMGVNRDGSVQAPINIYDSGWYTGSVKPGEVGSMFIDGHSSGSTHEGLFGNLDKLTIGDKLQVEKGDGTKLTYQVVHTETVDLDKVDMKKMLLPYGNAVRGLNLMTCTGSWIDSKSGQTLDKRILVFTEQV